MVYAFGDCELDLSQFELRVAGERRPIEPQVFDVLTHLLRNSDRVVTKEELLDEVWGDRFVSESALTSRVRAARAAVGDDGHRQEVIRTVHGRGYQFVADVRSRPTGFGEPPGTAGPGSLTEPRQKVRFVSTQDGFTLATAEVGTGPPLVKAANWLTHVELDWNSPVWRHWLEGLAAGHRFVRYDERGCGLSDWDLRGSRLDDVGTWVGDLEAVVDDLELDRFDLLGMSQGGVVAVAYAVRHPERVRKLILYGTYSRGMRRRGDEATARQAELQIELMRVGWGTATPAFRQVFTSLFMPDAGQEEQRWYTELQAATTSAENAVLFETAFYDVDISDWARAIDVPTMVMHCRDDAATSFEEGRLLASLIPDATFVSLPSANHILTADEPAWGIFLDELRQFTRS